MKVRIKNIIHSVLTRNHIEEHGFTSLSDKFGKQGMAYLRAVTLKDNDTDILNDYLDLWEETEKKIKEAEKRIMRSFAEHTRDWPYTCRYHQI